LTYNLGVRELDLLKHIYNANDALPGHVLIGPGDDAAVLRIGGSEVLVAVDQLADGVHVDLAKDPLEKVARKAITRNLSDVAAMAAVPTAAVVAASLPRGFGQSRAQQLFDAMGAVARAYGCPLVGGDISIWDHPLLLTVTILAQPDGIAPITRNGAQPGDCICVTGRLGGSGETIDGDTHHLDFEPRIKIARQLAADPDLAIHSMIDLSDGLAKDLAHLCRDGQGDTLAAQLWADRLPISAAAHAASHRDHTPPWQHALGDGEDYELCFTVPAEHAQSVVPSEIDGVPITPIGRMMPAGQGPMITLKLPDGSIGPVTGLGWQHHD